MADITANAGRGAQVLHMLRQGMGAPLVVMAMLAMIVVPLSPLVLDALFSFNIAISLVIVLAVVYIQRPLEFSIFPSILLMVTLLRLALNVASTRVILIHGHEGGAGRERGRGAGFSVERISGI